LYCIARRKNDTVANILSTVPLNISFRRALSGDRLRTWLDLVEKVAAYEIINGKDIFMWNLTNHKQFTMKSMYTNLMHSEGTPSDCITWKIKVPLKTKIFLWYLKKGVTLTKDNLAKRKWKGSTKCSFCSAEESIQHLFFDCYLARFIWNAVHIAFNIQQPTSISNMLGSWIKSFPFELRNQILVGAAALCWAVWLSRNDVVFERSP